MQTVRCSLLPALLSACLLVVALSFSGCGPGQAFGPTLTPPATNTPTSTPTLPATNTPTPTSTNTPSPTSTSTSTPTSTPTNSPTFTSTSTPTSTPTHTPDPAAGTVIGSIRNDPNTLLVLIPQAANGAFTVKVADDTPVATTDAAGRFEFGSVAPGIYIIVAPHGADSFQLYDPPADSSLVVDYLVMDIWTFRVRSHSITDLGELHSRQ